jgi:hypothetical protein
MRLTIPSRGAETNEDEYPFNLEEEEKIATAPTAPLWLASVKMSTPGGECVVLASHETSAIQGVVAAVD